MLNYGWNILWNQISVLKTEDVLTLLFALLNEHNVLDEKTCFDVIYTVSHFWHEREYIKCI